MFYIIKFIYTLYNNYFIRKTTKDYNKIIIRRKDIKVVIIKRL